MAKDLIEVHEAVGDLELIAVRYADDRAENPIGVVTLRWKDDGSDGIGESTRSRLVLELERDGKKVFVVHDEGRIPVEVAPAADGGGAILRAPVGETDLILTLPTF